LGIRKIYSVGADRGKYDPAQARCCQQEVTRTAGTHADEDHVSTPENPWPFFAPIVRMCRRNGANAAHELAPIVRDAVADFVQDLIQDEVAAQENNRPSCDLRVPLRRLLGVAVLAVLNLGNKPFCLKCCCRPATFSAPPSGGTMSSAASVLVTTVAAGVVARCSLSVDQCSKCGPLLATSDGCRDAHFERIRPATSTQCDK
jgi:hypothetical protein